MSEPLPQIPGGWTTREVRIGSTTFQLEVPDSPDAFLDDDDVQRANRETDYMPYWAWLWPAATKMARLILEERWSTPGRVLEIGAGVGLAGMASLACGHDVTFSDYDPVAVQVARRNARRNGLGPPVDEVGDLTLDWRRPHEHDVPPFPLIVGCDVIYEVATHAPVLNVLDRFLTPDGAAWIADPGRQYVPAFCRSAADRGYAIEVRDEGGTTIETLLGLPTVATTQFRLLILSRAA